MSAVYPLGPQEVPANLTAPSSNYKRHAWIAVAGVALFVVAYFALAAWFGWTAWRLFSNVAHARTDDIFASLLAGGCSAFLAVFMLKALFFVKHGQASEDVEVTAEDQPELFEFLARLAAETGAPKPRHVYVSGRVNAAVFYDLSIANLLFPSRKNLEIGLGLVNVLTLGELKAVLAHEFGHFAQKTMAVGRWVYIAQQIAGHIIAKRDMLDTFLVRLSNIDLRLAWIGWLLRIIVWSIRSLVELLFRGVVIAQRALSREMEFQADLVAVSVTGSDALIHALHKLAAADDAWERTLNFASTELSEKRGVKDLFAIQLKIIENTRSLLDDPIYGAAPPMPETQPEAHRVFKVALAAPPRMWATHPANSDREANAKRRYVRAPIDERSAWTVFDEPQALREQVSRHMVRAKEFAPVDIETSLASLAKDYSRDYLNPRYRGAYLGRSVVRHVSAIDELYDKSPGNATAAELDALYPPSLADDIERLRALGEERQMLVALREGFLTAPGGVIQHRGTAMTRKNLPKAIEAVERDLAACAGVVREHDRRCRSLHLAAAQRLGPDWAAYLKGLLEILHYADHVEANLLDAHGALAHTVNVATADGKVSKSELEGIMSAAKIAYNALEEIHTDDAVAKVVPDRTVLKRMNAESWRAALEKLGLPAPNQGNIGDWLNAFGGWVRSTASSLSSLRLAALEQLLAAENQVAQFTRKGMQPVAAPPASTVPSQYRLLTPGSERSRDAQLTWWDRFQMASGIMPTIARFAVAAVIIGAVLWAASGVGTSIVYVLNGLETAVTARINDKQVSLNPGAHVAVDIGRTDRVHVSTSTLDGRPIETFDTNTAGGSSQEIYNVAGAASFVEWTAVYGPASGAPERPLGAQRWFSTSAQVVLEEPPKSVSTKSGSGATRSVLSGFGDGLSARVLEAIPNGAEQKQVVLTHARWDDGTSRNVEEWLGIARQLPEFDSILAARIKDRPRDTVNLRFEQEVATGEQHEAVCERHRQLAAEAPDNSDLAYIAVRCIADADERDQAFLKLLQRWPDNAWIMQANAYIYAGNAQWTEANTLFAGAIRKLPQLTDRLVIEMARIERASANGRPADLRALQARSEYLSLMLAPETMDVSQAGVWLPYVLMAKGDLAQAVAAVKKIPGGDAHALQLIAASDGASAEMIEQAFALPVESVDGGLLISTLALAIRTGHDTTALTEQISKQLAGQSTRTLNAFTVLKNHGSRAQVEQAMRGLEPELRGQMYVAAAILRGAECPPEWRAAAKQLLFVSERPYLR